ncbi:hypothetical protein KI387_028075, partial [Taxus chinensis]
MVTGRPPWSNVSNPMAAMFRIGCTDEQPDLPMRLSPQGRDFLEKCFCRDPKKRWTAAQLLDHSFLNETDSCSVREVKRASWISYQHSGYWDVLIGIPPGPDSRFWLQVVRGLIGAQSPPTGQWIVVRLNSPPSNSLLPTIDCSSEEEAERNFTLMEDNDAENQQFPKEKSSAEDQHECEPSSRPITDSMIVDQAQELCKHSSQPFSAHSSCAEIHNRALGRDIV